MSERGRRNQLGELTLPIQNAEVAAMFDQVAEHLEIEGQNQFRVRAYRRAARVIEGLPQSVKGMLKAGKDLSELPRYRDGSGPQNRGNSRNRAFSKLLDTLKRKLPGELGEIAALPGLRPRRLKLLHDKLKISTRKETFRRTKEADYRKTI